jgi:glycosyltransferase involved in cell wall biosynthesis
MTQAKISIILPTLNEEETIGRVIDEIPRAALEEAGYAIQVLVVDGNSQDRTRKIAKDKGVEVMVEPRKGKGRAMRSSLKTVDADFIFMLDADYTYPATYIPDMLNILQHGYDVVMGSRLKGKREKGAMSRLNAVGNRLLSLIATVVYQRRISDVCTGYWALRSEVIPNLRLSADGFEFEAELFSQLAKKGYSIAELPIYYRRRPSPPKLSSLKDGTKIGWALITKRFCGFTD